MAQDVLTAGPAARRRRRAPFEHTLLTTISPSIGVIGDVDAASSPLLRNNIDFEVVFSPKHRIHEMLPEGLEINRVVDMIRSWLWCMRDRRLMIMVLQTKKVHRAMRRLQAYVRGIISERSRAVEEILEHWRRCDEEHRKLVNKCSVLQQHDMTKVHAKDFVHAFVPDEIKRAAILWVYWRRRQAFRKAFHRYWLGVRALRQKHAEMKRRHVSYQRQFLGHTEEAAALAQEMSELSTLTELTKAKAPRFRFGLSSIEIPALRVAAAKVGACPSGDMAKIQRALMEADPNDEDSNALQLRGVLAEGHRANAEVAQLPGYMDAIFSKIANTLAGAGPHPSPVHGKRPGHEPGPGRLGSLRGFLSSPKPTDSVPPVPGPLPEPNLRGRRGGPRGLAVDTGPTPRHRPLDATPKGHQPLQRNRRLVALKQRAVGDTPSSSGSSHAPAPRTASLRNLRPLRVTPSHRQGPGGAPEHGLPRGRLPGHPLGPLPGGAGPSRADALARAEGRARAQEPPVAGAHGGKAPRCAPSPAHAKGGTQLPRLQGWGRQPSG